MTLGKAGPLTLGKESFLGWRNVLLLSLALIGLLLLMLVMVMLLLFLALDVAVVVAVVLKAGCSSGMSSFPGAEKSTLSSLSSSHCSNLSL